MSNAGTNISPSAKSDQRYEAVNSIKTTADKNRLHEQGMNLLQELRKSYLRSIEINMKMLGVTTAARSEIIGGLEDS